MDLCDTKENLRYNFSAGLPFKWYPHLICGSYDEIFWEIKETQILVLKQTSFFFIPQDSCKQLFLLLWFQKGLVVQRLMMSCWLDLRRWQAILFITCYNVEYFSHIETCIKFYPCMSRGNHSIYTQDVGPHLAQCMLDILFLSL